MIVFSKRQISQELQDHVEVIRVLVDRALFLRAHLADDRLGWDREVLQRLDRLLILHVSAAVDKFAQLFLEALRTPKPRLVFVESFPAALFEELIDQ